MRVLSFNERSNAKASKLLLESVLKPNLHRVLMLVQIFNRGVQEWKKRQKLLSFNKILSLLFSSLLLNFHKREDKLPFSEPQSDEDKEVCIPVGERTLLKQPGDGHCLIHSVRECLRHSNVRVVPSCEGLLQMLANEVLSNLHSTATGRMRARTSRRSSHNMSRTTPTEQIPLTLLLMLLQIACV